MALYVEGSWILVRGELDKSGLYPPAFVKLFESGYKQSVCR